MVMLGNRDGNSIEFCQVEKVIYTNIQIAQIAILWAKIIGPSFG